MRGRHGRCGNGGPCGRHSCMGGRHPDDAGQRVAKQRRDPDFQRRRRHRWFHLVHRHREGLRGRDRVRVGATHRDDDAQRLDRDVFGRPSDARTPRRHLHRPGRALQRIDHRRQPSPHLHGRYGRAGRHHRRSGQRERDRDTTPAANGSAGNATGDSSSIAIKIFAGTTTSGSPLQSFTVTKSGSAWSGVLGQLTPGTYTLQAAQADDLGNAALVTSTFTVDTAPPVVTLSSPADRGSGTDTPTFGGTASDPGNVTVRVYSGGDLVRSLSALNFFGGWTIRASPALAAGTYTVQAAQTDAAGNTGTSAPRSFTVTTPALRLLTPFPIVRIVGRLTRTGAKLSLLSIRAPAQATVEVRCRGRSCRSSARSRMSARGRGP